MVVAPLLGFLFTKQGLVDFEEDSILDEDFEADDDSEDEEQEDDSDDYDEDDEGFEDEDEELTLGEELADLHKLAALEELAGAEDSGFEDPISYVRSLEQASILLEELRCQSRSYRPTPVSPTPMVYVSRPVPTQDSVNLDADLMVPVDFSRLNSISPTRPARQEYICPHEGCPIRTQHRTGEFSLADTDRPFQICFLELNLRKLSLSFADFMTVHAFYAAHEKPLGSENCERFETQVQVEEDACAGAEEVKVKAPGREVRIAEYTASIERLIDEKIEKLLTDRAKQANADRSKVLLDLLMEPTWKP